MRKLLSLLLLLMAAGLHAQSVPQGRVQPTYIVQDGQVLGQLALDTMQRRQLEAVERRYQQAMDALAANYTISDKAASVRAEELAAGRQVEFKAILTPDQFARWQQMEAARPPN
ncbi:MAG: hypothetical protein IPM46_02740 [Flavobacteriales bacterium]|nr:hypothetical protein [Flavobacteriales bacterium]